MKQIITFLVSTNGGWVTRQLLKYAGIGLGSFSAWLAAKGVAAEQATMIVGGITAGLAVVIEQGLSLAARKYAVK